MMKDSPLTPEKYSATLTSTTPAAPARAINGAT